MRIEKCWFCSSTIYPGHGIQFVRNDAKIFRFCRSKCHKNFKMKRNPRKVKWTKAYRRLHGKDMTQDSTFEFERKRNRPERYDRNLTENTLKAIKTIDKVRSRREAKHIETRKKGKKAQLMREAVKELEQSINLVKAPGAFKEDNSLTLPKIKVKKEGKEGPADERGSKGAGAKHQLGQSPRCFQGGQFSHSSKDQGQGISNTGRESTHGRMSAVIFMFSCSDRSLQYVVLIYCLEAKVLSSRQPSYQKKFVVLLFLFLIIGSNELYTFLIWLLKEGKEGPADERGSKGAGAKHQLGQSPRCFQGGQFSHSSKDQGQGISNTGRESTHGRMSAVIFMFSCSDIILRYVVLIYCLEAKVLSSRQTSYQKKFCCAFVFVSDHRK
ncbi:putative ribosome biogenesis protein rlp24 [Quercus suber]|uniref:Ribosome biogenesis protein rlp24 n=1 Tax=Quercus suber TaxID=58331 RepID=A0AAW0IVP7_QUESU